MEIFFDTNTWFKQLKFSGKDNGVLKNRLSKKNREEVVLILK